MRQQGAIAKKHAQFNLPVEQLTRATTGNPARPITPPRAVSASLKTDEYQTKSMTINLPETSRFRLHVRYTPLSLLDFHG